MRRKKTTRKMQRRAKPALDGIHVVRRSGEERIKPSIRCSSARNARAFDKPRLTAEEKPAIGTDVMQRHHPACTPPPKRGQRERSCARLVPLLTKRRRHSVSMRPLRPREKRDGQAGERGLQRGEFQCQKHMLGATARFSSSLPPARCPQHDSSAGASFASSRTRGGSSSPARCCREAVRGRPHAIVRDNRHADVRVTSASGFGSGLMFFCLARPRRSSGVGI